MFLPPDAMPFAAVDAQALFQVRRDFLIWRNRNRPIPTHVDNAVRKVLDGISTALNTQLGDQVAWNAAVANLRSELRFIDLLYTSYPGFQAFANQQASFLAGRGVL